MDSTNELWGCTNYIAPLSYIIDSQIYEFDIRKANISILYDKGKIDRSMYDRLLNMPKQEREIAIGKLILKNKDISAYLKQGIEEARKSLFAILKLDETNVLAIKNDAVFVVKNSIVDYPQSVRVGPNVVFINKNVYRSFYKIARKEMFYSYDPITGMEGMDIKGLGDHAINLHKNYLIDWIMRVFYIAIANGPKSALDECSKFYDSYVKRKLHLGYYRRFDSYSQYDIRNMSDWSTFRTEFLSEGAAESSIDIGYNATFISELAKMYLNELLKNK